MAGMENDKEIVRRYKDLLPDYEWQEDIFTQEDDRVEAVKRIVFRSRCLTLGERIIILSYIDCQSFRKLGAALGIGKETCRRLVSRIREKILEEYRKNSEK